MKRIMDMVRVSPYYRNREHYSVWKSGNVPVDANILHTIRIST